MTHDELLQKIDDEISNGLGLMAVSTIGEGLKAVVELHKPRIITNIHSGKKYFFCSHCLEEQGDYMSPKEVSYPCSTIEAIIKGMES